MQKPSSITTKSGFGFDIRKDGLGSHLKASPFQKFASSSEQTLPKFHTDENEKKYLQASGVHYQEEDLYDPLNPTEEIEPQKPKKRRKKS